MKFFVPRFSMRSLVAGMLLFGAVLGMVGRELFQIRTKAERQQALIKKFQAKGVSIAAREKMSLSALESVVTWMEGKGYLSTVPDIALGSATLDGEDLRQIAELDGLATVFDKNVHLDDASMKLLGMNPTLKIVFLDQGWRGSEEGAIDLVSGQAPLQEIYLGLVPLSDRFLVHAAGKPDLEILNVNSGAITSAGIARLKSAPSLKRLDIINGCNLLEGVTALSEHPQFVDLRLYDYRFGDRDLAAFGEGFSVEKLQIVTKEFPPGILQAVLSCPKLKQLFFEGKMPDDETVDLIACKEIERIWLSHFGPDASDLIERLAPLRNLKSIVLPRASLTSEDMDKLAHFQSLRTLQIAAGTPPEAISRLQKAIRCNVTTFYPDGRRFQYKADGGKPNSMAPAPTP